MVLLAGASGIALALAALAGGGPAHAVDREWIGVAGGNWDTAGNWSPAGEPVGADQVHVNNGSGPTVTTASNAITRYFLIGETAGTSGELIIAPGGSLTIGLYLYLGVAAGAAGVAEVNGPGATLTARSIRVGSAGTGDLLIQGGGVFTLNGPQTAGGTLQIGREAGGVGTVTVTGAGSLLNVLNSEANVGLTGTGTLNVEDGGTVTIAGDLIIARNNTSASVTVDGVGSSLSSGGTITVGNVGAGVMTVSNGGTVTSGDSILHLGTAWPSSSGILNIGDGGAPGTINATTIIGGGLAGARREVVLNPDPDADDTLGASPPGVSGSAASNIVNFNHNDPGFVFGTLMTGQLSVNQIGTGTTILTADNNYAGLTTITDGILQLGNGGTTGSVTGNIVDDAHLSINRSNTFLYAGVISGSGTVSQDGTGLTIFTGDNIYTGVTTINAGALQLGNGGTTGSVVGDITNNTSLTINRSNTYNYGGVISGPGTLTIEGGGIFALSQQQLYTGVTTINSGTLQAGVADVISTTSSLAVNSGGIFNQAGFSQTLPTVTNAGAILTGGTPPGTTLTVQGAYVGAGGLLGLNTFLGTDGSPSDRLVIDGGTATGTTALQITNIGGPGAATTGNGILVIDAVGAGTTAPGAFSLAGPVLAGTFEYRLFRGASDGSAPEDWFLRSIFRADRLVHLSIPPLGTEYGFSILGTMHERTGDPLAFGQGGDCSSAAAGGYATSGKWGRVLGESGKRRLASDAGHSWRTGGIQAGLDLFRGQSPNGDCDRAGVYFGVGHLGADVNQVQPLGPGNANFNAYTAGGYWTRFAPSGGYLDAVVQGTFYDANAQALARFDASGWGFAASLEAGQPIFLPSGFVIEPQAQLAYQRVAMNDASDGTALISFRPTDALLGRIGARFIRPLPGGSVWLRANLSREFIGKTGITLSGLAGENPATFSNPFDGTWGEIGLGATGTIAANTTLFAAATYRHGLDGKNHQMISARAGLNRLW